MFCCTRNSQKEKHWISKCLFSDLLKITYRKRFLMSPCLEEKVKGGTKYQCRIQEKSVALMWSAFRSLQVSNVRIGCCWNELPKLGSRYFYHSSFEVSTVRQNKTWACYNFTGFHYRAILTQGENSMEVQGKANACFRGLNIILKVKSFVCTLWWKLFRPGRVLGPGVKRADTVWWVSSNEADVLWRRATLSKFCPSCAVLNENVQHWWQRTTPRPSRGRFYMDIFSTGLYWAFSTASQRTDSSGWSHFRNTLSQQDASRSSVERCDWLHFILGGQLFSWRGDSFTWLHIEAQVCVVCVCVCMCVCVYSRIRARWNRNNVRMGKKEESRDISTQWEANLNSCCCSSAIKALHNLPKLSGNRFDRGACTTCPTHTAFVEALVLSESKKRHPGSTSGVRGWSDCLPPVQETCPAVATLHSSMQWLSTNYLHPTSHERPSSFDTNDREVVSLALICVFVNLVHHAGFVFGTSFHANCKLHEVSGCYCVFHGVGNLCLHNNVICEMIYLFWLLLNFNDSQHLPKTEQNQCTNWWCKSIHNTLCQCQDLGKETHEEV